MRISTEIYDGKDSESNDLVADDVVIRPGVTIIQQQTKNWYIITKSIFKC